MTPQEENEAISIWAGIECRCKRQFDELGLTEYHYWGDCPRHSNGGLPPDYDRDEVDISLLNDIPNWLLSIYGTFGPPPVIGEWSPTIAAAIKGAIKMLLEKEKS